MSLSSFVLIINRQTFCFKMRFRLVFPWLQLKQSEQCGAKTNTQRTSFFKQRSLSRLDRQWISRQVSFERESVRKHQMTQRNQRNRGWWKKAKYRKYVSVQESACRSPSTVVLSAYESELTKSIHGFFFTWKDPANIRDISELLASFTASSE